MSVFCFLYVFFVPCLLRVAILVQFFCFWWEALSRVHTRGIDTKTSKANISRTRPPIFGWTLRKPPIFDDSQPLFTESLQMPMDPNGMSWRILQHARTVLVGGLLRPLLMPAFGVQHALVSVGMRVRWSNTHCVLCACAHIQPFIMEVVGNRRKSWEA